MQADKVPSSLPPKENALFKRILKCYEQKQYKNGIKFAKQILSSSKFADHGETLAMKGLMLNCLGRKDEAYDCVRRGLRKDLRSHVCWHVYGLLQRSDKKYDEAIKAYRNALRWDPENMQILRDLSLLQIQMRDLSGYQETRYKLFQLRSGQRASWIGFAMSHHLMKDYDVALRILDEFRKTLQKVPHDYEQSELLIYQNSVIQESGDYVAALSHLEENWDMICDPTAALEMKADILTALLDQPKHEDDNKREWHASLLSVLDELITRNADNRRYLDQLAKFSDRPRLETYEVVAGRFPRALMPRRLALAAAAPGQEFDSRIPAYLDRALTKGVPPLLADLLSLYTEDLDVLPICGPIVKSNRYGLTAKAKEIQRLCTEYIANPAAKSDLFATQSDVPVSTYPWTAVFLANHFDVLGDRAEAMKYVDLAIQHTPTLIEIYLTKAKIEKHNGNITGAADTMMQVQAFDTADRCLNCTTVKYLFRACRIADAETLAKNFTFREGSNVMDSLHEMQCMWFQLECAESYERQQRWGDALKKCWEIDRHFEEIIDDQFDFHTYCMRKMTLYSYVKMLRLEDGLRGHKFYIRAAECAIRIYIRLHDTPLSAASESNDIDAANMDPAEARKLRNKQKKAKRKAELAEIKRKEAAASAVANTASASTNAKRQHDEELDAPVKVELVPAELEQIASPLDEAVKFLLNLTTFAPDRFETLRLAFQIAVRRCKVLMMLQVVKRMARLVIDGACAGVARNKTVVELECNLMDLHHCIVAFNGHLEAESGSESGRHPAVAETLALHSSMWTSFGNLEPLKSITPDLTTLIFANYDSSQARNKAMVIYFASISSRRLPLYGLLRVSQGEKDVKLADVVANLDLERYYFTLQTCMEFDQWSQLLPSGDVATVSQLRTKFKSVWPLSTVFD